jgi:hypothetical protein
MTSCLDVRYDSVIVPILDVSSPVWLGGGLAKVRGCLGVVGTIALVFNVFLLITTNRRAKASEDLATKTDSIIGQNADLIAAVKNQAEAEQQQVVLSQAALQEARLSTELGWRPHLRFIMPSPMSPTRVSNIGRGKRYVLAWFPYTSPAGQTK